MDEAAVDGGLDGTMAGVEESAPAERPSRPDVPLELRRFTAELMAELGDTSDWLDACRSREQDREYLRPDAAGAALRREAKASTRGTTMAKDVDSVETREVRVPWVSRQAEQTVAGIVSSNISVSCNPKKKLKRTGTMTGPITPKDEAVMAFGETCQWRASRVMATQGQGLGRRIKRWVTEATWFRYAVLRLTRSNELGPVPRLEDQSLKENIDRIQQIRMRMAYGDIQPDAAEAVELRNLLEVVQGDKELEIEHRWRGEVVPLHRWRVSPEVLEPDDVDHARWQAYLHLMRRDQVERRFPFMPAQDGTWSGVHPDDLCNAAVHDGYVSTVQKDEIERRRVAQAVQLNVDPNSVRVDQSEILLVYEIEHREMGKVFFLIDGVPYPVGEYVPEYPAKRWYTGHFLTFNEGPDSIAGMSDTEQQGPIQDRMNRKDSDFEKARFLGMTRGWYPTDEIDPHNAHHLELPPPGKIKGIPSGKIDDIRKLIQWMNAPVNAECYDKSDDWNAWRFMARQSEQSMGMTGGGTTATAIMEASRGTQVAFKNRKNLVRDKVIDVVRHILEVEIQAVPPETVLADAGPDAFWPRFLDKKQVAQITRQIQLRVQAEVADELEQMKIAALDAGQQMPQADWATVDRLVAERTSAAWMELTGLDEPMTRQELYESLDVEVDVGVDGGADEAAKAQVASQLGTTLVNLNGGQPIPGMVNALAKRLGKLMGEDTETWMAINPMEAVQALMTADPSSLPPEALQALAQMGAGAQQMLMQAAATEQGGEGQAAQPTPTPGVPQAPRVPSAPTVPAV